MGGKSSSQTVGYKYCLGMHYGCCHGPIDKFTMFKCDDKVAWEGEGTGGTVSVDNDGLFGGDKREGGVQGLVDICMGGPDQLQNPYLVTKLGALIPAYRGIAALVFRGNSGAKVGIWEKLKKYGTAFYFGNNPYLKSWTVRGQRIYVREEGQAQWMPELAGISANPITSVDLTQYFPVLTQNVDPSYPTPGNFYPGIITIGPYNSSCQVIAGNADGTGYCRPDDRFYFNDEQFNSSDAPVYQGGTVLYNLAPNDTLTIKVKNTVNPYSGVTGSLTVKFAGRMDMNPAHIIRECLTSVVWGMGYSDDDVDDDSFAAAARTFYNEGLGMSLLWDKSKELEDFISVVEQHVDCAVYVSNTTGKFKIKPIRADYDESTLITLDESNIISVSDPNRVVFGELTNSVTVKYWNAETGNDGSVTVSDPALTLQQGATINASVEYPGFTTSRNATIAAQRDLRALSTPLLSCTIMANTEARELELGDVFKFSWAKWNLVDVVMRITGIAYGTGRNKRVKIICTQDVFDTDTNVTIVTPENSWENPSAPPSAPEHELAIEAPYYELVQALGQSTIDAKLSASPEISYILAAASQPNSAINASLWTNDGTEYEDVGVFDFAPDAVLETAISKTQTTFYLDQGADLGNVVIGTHVQIDDELMRVDELDDDTGAIVVGRGILDTVPAEHAAGAAVLFWDQFVGFDPTEYVQGEEIEVKITPISGAGELPIAEAEELTVELVGRANRPYAPGDLRLNGDSYKPNAFYEGEVAITWAHRDRLQQTSGVLVDHTAGNIGPEVGTLYRVQGYVNDVLVHTEDNIDGTSAVWTPEDSGVCRVEVHANRGGVYSFQAPSHTFLNANFMLTEDGDIRITEDGDEKVSE